MAKDCPECGSGNIASNDEGCDVCTDCGLIIGGGSFVPAVNVEPNEPRRAREKAPKAPRRSRHVSSKERWTATLKQLAARAGLNPAIAETAAMVYGTAVDMPDWKNRKHDYQVGVLVACMYHACNIHMCHRTPSELCAALALDPRNARRMVKVTERAAGEVEGKGARTRRTFVPTEVLPRCACRLGSLPRDRINEVRRIARRFYEEARADIDNHRPDTITAGLLSVAVKEAGLDVADAEIAEACLVAPNTVKSISKHISAAAARLCSR